MILAIENVDLPGVIGFVGTLLAKNNINIQQFELSRNQKGGKAMALVVVDEAVNKEIIQQLLDHELIKKVKHIVI